MLLELQCGRPVVKNPIILLLLLLFLSLTGDQLLFQVLMVLKVIYHIVLTLSREIFALICFVNPIFRAFCVDLILRDLSSKILNCINTAN